MWAAMPPPWAGWTAWSSAGGIGENDAGVRAGVCKDMEFLGIQIDEEKNQVRGQDILDLTAPGSQGKGVGHLHQ